jgi:uncharacterized glyoxalase superfamily metalloenzyme YdcJ
MKRSITIGPFGVFFTNVNTAMKLAGHSHYGEITLRFATLEARGFPAFATTYAVVQSRLVELTAKPFRDATNEDVADQLFAAFDGWTDPAIASWGGAWQLDRLDLAVRGVLDKIGHADGFTTYSVERHVSTDKTV